MEYKMMQHVWTFALWVLVQVLVLEGVTVAGQEPLGFFSVTSSSGHYMFTPVNRWAAPPQSVDVIDWSATPGLESNYTAESYAETFGWQFVVLEGSFSVGCKGGTCGLSIFTVVQTYIGYVQFAQKNFSSMFFLRANAPVPGMTPTVKVLNSGRNKGLLRVSAASKLTPGILEDLEARELTRSYPLIVGPVVLRGGARTRNLLTARRGGVAIITAVNLFFPLGQVSQCPAETPTQGPTSCVDGQPPSKSCSVGADGCLSCTSTCTRSMEGCGQALSQGSGTAPGDSFRTAAVDVFRTPPRRKCRRAAFVPSFWPSGPNECCNRVCLPVFIPSVKVSCR